MKFIVVIAALLGEVFAQQTGNGDIQAAIDRLQKVPESTGFSRDGNTDWVNGRYWAIFSENEKLFYVYGFRESYAQNALAKCSVISIPWPMTTVDIVRGLDHFYQDPANVKIPVVHAVVFVGRRFLGADPAETETLIAKWRGMWAGK